MNRHRIRTASFAASLLAVAACDLPALPPGSVRTPATDPRNAEMHQAAAQPDGYEAPLPDQNSLRGGEKKIKWCGFIDRVLPNSGEDENQGKLFVYADERAALRDKLKKGQVPAGRYYALVTKGEYVSVPAAEGEAFANNLAAGQVCVWVDEVLAVDRPKGTDAGFLHLPLAKWDGVLKHRLPEPPTVPASSSAPTAPAGSAAPASATP